MDRYLAVRKPNGILVIPSAEMIYSACVEGAIVNGIPPIDANSLLGNLTFSRYPLRPIIVIEPNSDTADLPLRVTVYAVDKNTTVPLTSIANETPDHILTDQCWFPIVPDSLDEVRQVLGKAEIKELGPITLRQYLDLLKFSFDRSLIKDMSDQAANASSYQATPELDTAPLFIGTLFPYQRDGLRWLYTITSQEVGGILADEMGLGKTIQLVAVLANETFEGRTPSVVVAPGTLLENWRREIARFAPSLRTVIHRGAERTGFPEQLSNNAIVITSYDTLVRDLSLFVTVDWNVVVLDEAQAIKNPETLRASSVRKLPRRVGIAVTGTPVENRLRDLWSITDFAVPGLLGSQSEFEKTFKDDASGALSLEPRISPILLRRRVDEVATDLPERIEIPQPLELDGVQSERYEKIREDTIAEYGESANLVALTRLRMFCTHPALIQIQDPDLTAESVKYKRLTEILEEILSYGEKAVLFTSFNRMSDFVVEDVHNRFGVHTFSIDGRTPIEDRQSIIDVLNDIPGGSVLVLNPNAAGTGLNITMANHVIHYNLEWNPAVEDQASARVYRRGQTRPVTIHRLYYVNTVEEIINDRLSRKRELADTAVVGTDGSDDGVEDILLALQKSPITGTSK